MKGGNFVWLMVFGIGLLLLGGGSPLAPSAPFKTDKLSVLAVEESSERGKYTQDQLNILQATDAKSVKATVEGKGGRFFVLDKDNAGALEKADDWVKAAFPKLKDNPPPWIAGANTKSGFSIPLATEAEVLKKVGGL